MIIFLGAGASTPFEIPTMPGFIEIFDKLLNEHEIYCEIRDSFEKESFDLEALMTILEDLSKDQNQFLRTISPQTSNFLFNHIKRNEKNAKQILAHSKERRQEATNCLHQIKSIIRKKCFEAVQQRSNKILQVYDQLFGIFKGSEIGNVTQHAGDGILMYHSNLKIFTTNYDTCIETYLNRHQVLFTQGIVPRYGYNVFDIDSFDDRDDKVGLFKLHGSVDLFRKNGQIRQLPVYTSEQGSTYLGEEFGEELMRYPIEFGGYRNVIESPYLDLFRIFRDRIRNDHVWLLIGSSFRDITICSIINDVLRLQQRGQNPIIILVNPSGKAIADRLEKWGMGSFSSLIRTVEQRFGTDECIKELGEVFNPQRTIRKKVPEKR